jgi:hypothetical protein
LGAGLGFSFFLHTRAAEDLCQLCINALPGPHLVYGFLKTAPNTVVRPIHPKAMPVMLTTPGECDV